ncbi:MafI family immunity protein [Terrimicrobium sacchariphilum]|nr:MafI family immunity protein [Terrimicrobium sacchariphilum]
MGDRSAGRFFFGEEYDDEEVTMSETMNEYEMTRAQLADLVEETQGCLSTEELATVRGYLEHGECGLAFEHLCDALRGGTREISPRQYARLERLGIRMEIDSMEWLGLPHGRRWHVREFRQRPTVL